MEPFRHNPNDPPEYRALQEKYQGLLAQRLARDPALGEDKELENQIESVGCELLMINQ